jgi:predicted transcriptional regulator
MRHLRIAFGGDLDLLMILMAIAERTPSDAWETDVTDLSQILDAPDVRRPQRPINIQSVSDFTGIPRETVRRKVGRLEKMGWVLRNADGTLSVAPQAAVDLEEATGQTILYLAEVIAAYDASAGRKG